MIQLADLLTSSAAALIIAGCFFVTAYVVALKISPPSEPLIRSVAVIGSILWLATGCFHLLAYARLFAALPALMLGCALATAAYVWAGGREPLTRAFRRDARFLRRMLLRVRRSRYRWCLLAFTISATPSLLHALLLPPLAWDTLTYHGLKAGMWVANGELKPMRGTGPWGYYPNMLGGGEVFQAWAMLPFHGDTLAPLADVLEFLLLGFVLVVLARRLRIREPFASAAAAFVLSLPTTLLLVGSGYVEISQLLALLTGMILVFEGTRRTAGGPLQVVGAGALGVAGATKLPALPLAAAMLCIALLASWRRTRWPWKLSALCAFAVAVGPWLVNAAALTGYPFSPVPVRIGGVTLGQAPAEVQWYMEQPRMRAYAVQTEVTALRKIFGPPYAQNEALGVFAVVPLVVGLVSLPQLFMGAAVAGTMFAVAVLIDVSGYYAPDFSMVRLYWTISSSRFLLPAVALLTVTSVAWCRRSRVPARIYFGFLFGASLFNLLTHASMGFSRTSAAGVGMLAGGALVLALLVKMLARGRAQRVSWAGALLLALAGLQIVRGSFREELFKQDYALHPVPKYWTAALGYVDTPGTPHRIAVTSGPYQYLDNWFAAPFLGRELQNSLLYEPVSADGTLYRFGDVRSNEDLRRIGSFDAWVSRLRRNRVTEIMSFLPPSLELEWMEARPDVFDRLCGEPHRWGLFHLREGERVP